MTLLVNSWDVSLSWARPGINKSKITVNMLTQASQKFSFRAELNEMMKDHGMQLTKPFTIVKGESKASSTDGDGSNEEKRDKSKTEL